MLDKYGNLKGGTMLDKIEKETLYWIGRISDRITKEIKTTTNDIRSCWTVYPRVVVLGIFLVIVTALIV